MIDRQYEEWNQIWWELTTPASKWDGFKYMIGDASVDHDISKQTLGMVQIPLKFLNTSQILFIYVPVISSRSMGVYNFSQ